MPHFGRICSVFLHVIIKSEAMASSLGSEVITAFILRGKFAPRTTKEERRLVREMRGLSAKVDAEKKVVRVWYMGDNLYVIARMLMIIGSFPGHELSLHEY